MVSVGKRPIDENRILAAEAAIAALELTVKFLVTDYTVEFLVNKVTAEEYYVPNYQRRFIWKHDAQSRFIESVLMGLPIPFVFLWQDDDGRLEIVDGSQRLRTLESFCKGELKLRNLELLPELNGLSYEHLSRSRQRKFGARVIRGIVLDSAVSAVTRTEMFNRINTGGQKANDAEVRRGALPGPFTDLIDQCAEDPTFVEMTPISATQVSEREREELVIRFFTYLNAVEERDGQLDLPRWKDRPADYIYDFAKAENARCLEDGGRIEAHTMEFQRMIEFVRANFPNGFRKTATATQIPRVRFEALSVGTGLALRTDPDLAPQDVSWLEGAEFAAITRTDGANVRAKLLGRIRFVKRALLINA